MKSFPLATLALAGICLATSASAAETYRFDPNHTQVAWKISHFGFSNPSGKIQGVTGSVTLDETKPANSKVNATIPVKDLLTGIDKLDEHLKGKGFFDTATYPTATFVSDKVTLTGKDQANVTGMLTLHGVTRPVTLDVHLNRIGLNMMKRKTAGFSITTQIKRSDFGMTQYLPAGPNMPGLGDEVKIGIEAEANQE